MKICALRGMKLAISHFWEACNEHDWLDLRRKYFDSRTTDRRHAEYLDSEKIIATLDTFVERRRTFRNAALFKGLMRLRTVSRRHKHRKSNPLKRTTPAKNDRNPA